MAQLMRKRWCKATHEKRGITVLMKKWWCKTAHENCNAAVL